MNIFDKVNNKETKKLFVMYLKNFNEYLIDINSSFQDALFQLNNLEFKFLVVLENEKVKGTLTDGDIRRVLLDNSKIAKLKIFKRRFYFCISEENLQMHKKSCKQRPFSPVLDSKKHLVAAQIIDKNKFKRTDYESNVLIMVWLCRRLVQLQMKRPNQ